MSAPLVLTMPVNDELRDHIKQQLAPYADVQVQPPSAFDLETVKLFIEVVGGTAGIAANIAAVLTYFRSVQDQAKHKRLPSGIRVGRLGEHGVLLEDADEEFLRELLVGKDEGRGVKDKQ
jgi:hypothetical protein